eukprot:TRINITY_DN55958_c0_g2_i1.p1 TRINITY_DN55958_c0_g2~~TRINITY_DN55958_c0_g2_i1.p1  ORF type:complete len:352 (+),score=52.85 TRINITY_DN55958_c0_g2_i1:79-1134(+)
MGACSKLVGALALMFLRPCAGMGNETETSTRASVASSPVNVITYNLFWWCVSDEYKNCPQFAGGLGFQQLYSRINMHGPFDLIGFQECDNVGQVIGGLGLTGKFEYYTDPVDGPMAWNGQKFQLIPGSSGSVVIGSDQYGDRYVNFVRLTVLETGGTIFFANVHGPLGHCDGAAGDSVANAYIGAIQSRIQPGDDLIFTGDFNCASNQETIVKLSTVFSNDAVDTSFGGADHIFTNGLQMLSQEVANGAPSDHQIVKASFQLRGGGPAPSPPPPPGPAPGPGPVPPVPEGCKTGVCCTTCEYNHYCPSNGGCYKDGQAGCAGGYCPAPSSIASSPSPAAPSTTSSEMTVVV